jgi:glycosyltransferase involved in cell wall biosynthesis
MEACARDAQQAARMGEQGLQSVRALTWPHVTERLLRAGFEEAKEPGPAPTGGKDAIKVAILDMQPIEPAVGGGRLRLLGLYHALGEGMQARYVGSYDWPGEQPRRQPLTPSLEEVVVPLSDDHHMAARRLSQAAGGKVVIDIAFTRLVHLSADYVDAVRAAVDWADVLVFSHPWVYPAVADRVRRDHLVVYDSQNVEGFLRAQLLDLRSPVERDLLRAVIAAENDVGRRADLVLVCSLDDKAMFERVYEWPGERIRLAPNGVMAKSVVPAIGSERSDSRRSLGLGSDSAIAVFIGSAYGPNVDAARFIIETLAPALPQVTFAVVGGVGDRLGGSLPRNVKVTGSVSEEAKRTWLKASDFAVNPMTSGSGTNIKMFDFMAAGLPVVTTATGGRGIGDAEDSALLVVDRADKDFVDAVRRLASDPEGRAGRGRRARALIESSFSWERISPAVGDLLRSSLRAIHRERSTKRRLVAVFTTWNIRCGIAEHSAYLADAFVDRGWGVVVLGNDLPPTGPVSLSAELAFPCVRVWHWDNRNRTGSRIFEDRLREALARLSPDVLLVQHHTGFLSSEQYRRVVGAAAALKVPVLLETHNAREWKRSGWYSLFAEENATIIVHDDEEREMLEALDSVRIAKIPLPIRSVGDHNEGDPNAMLAPHAGGPLVGGFGFLRPHKGVKRAIQILAALKPAYPDIKYAGYHAGYQSAESDRYLQECLTEAARLGIADSVVIDTRFRDIDEVVHCLRQVDVVLLPYEESFEGASASANVALAAGRPTVTSSSRIFNPLKDVVAMVRGDDTGEYVRTLDRLFRDGNLRREWEEKIRVWGREHSYQAAVGRLIELIPAPSRAP